RFGYTRKLNLGPWFRTPLRILARLRFLRGTPLDIFGITAHRRLERSLIPWYRGLIEEALALLTPENESHAIAIASLPDQIRGYEGIKEANISRVRKVAEEKLSQMQSTIAARTV
ncbi:MAG: hypothetical protein JNL62_15260, partial [Bryobacterales bacterium]|nr:hypothetical protein [Bryobacterales bacterium]